MDSERQEGVPSGGITPASEGSATLSRELSDLLIELSIAIHKHAMYPPGHPSLGPAATNVTGRLDDLLRTRQSLAIGVARKQLVIEGVATDSKNPVLTDLAGRLHAHHLGAVSFAKGVTPFEVESFLKAVAVDAEREATPLGLRPTSERNAIPHVNLYPVAYDRLQLVDDDEVEKGQDTRATREARTRSAQLWVGLARAAMALDELGDDEDFDEMHAEPSLVARAIQEQKRGTAYDQVIVGYLLQIADEVKNAGGTDALQLKNRMTKLVSHLDPGTLRKLLEMGGDRGQRSKFLMDASAGMSVDAVIKLAHAASQTREQGISHSMLRILQKLAHHAEAGAAVRRQIAEQSVRDHISELISEWSLSDPNPDEYTLALQRMARASPMFRVSTESAFRPDAKRVVQMALEVNVSGPAVLHAANELVESHQFEWLDSIMAEAQAPDVQNAIWKDLATEDRLEDILAADPIDVELLDGILPRLGMEAAEPMMEALIASESRQARRVLLDRLIEMGRMVAPLAVARLADSRWYVQRNMLAIIGELDEIPEGFHADDFFRHPDERVRREAFHIMFHHDALRERAICRAVADPDPRNARLGLAAALDDCPKAAMPLIVSRVMSGDSSSELKEAAIRVLGRVGDGASLDILLGLIEPRRSMLRMRLPAKTPEYLAALRAVQPSRDQPRVRAALRAAARSRDPEIVSAATKRETVELAATEISDE